MVITMVITMTISITLILTLTFTNKKIVGSNINKNCYIMNKFNQLLIIP